MNRCILLNLSHPSGVHMSPAICILHTCRCYTHLGASQDSRAGNGH
ncbi:hypothetical protein VC862_06930 [Citrobacter braakii]|nr:MULTISPECIES: hypothetical protein [Citrobacter]MEB0966464.1 hypothetical protein [Citrobacter braakii]MEB1004327.1 hypothetical protein [Citrobacter braakii]WBA62188.1 hypothetical protein O6D90_03945 [Citrobacter sp. 21OH12SH02A-Citro]